MPNSASAASSAASLIRWSRSRLRYRCAWSRTQTNNKSPSAGPSTPITSSPPSAAGSQVFEFDPLVRHERAACRRCRARPHVPHGSARSARCRSFPPQQPPLPPRIVAAGGDTQQSAHGGDRISRLVIAHEGEPFGGIAFVSRANQAAAFERISRSSLSWLFSRRRRLSSSRSAVIRPPSPRPVSRFACAT